jgi:hypothetical protein
MFNSMRSILVLALALPFAACAPKRPPVTALKDEEVETTLFLIGDAGEQDPRQSSLVLDSLKRQAAAAPGRSVIVFLGDNVYPNGIPRDSSLDFADARRRLRAQVDAVPPGAKAIFVPGNHDWSQGTAFGLYAVRLEEQLIRAMARGRDIRMLPGNGCPGPVPVELGRLRLITLDTQWWLHDYIVHDSVSSCPHTTGEVTAALRNLIATTPDGRIAIAVGHHPMMTGGIHGGYCGITGPFRRLGGASQDILSSLNRQMRDSLQAAFSAKPPILYAAGHDHNLQVMKGAPSAQYFVVSGAGSQGKTECAVYLRESYYVSQHRVGFMRVDVMRDKGVMLSVFDFSGAGVPGRSFSRGRVVR